jgi:hypothetical protein
VKRRRWDKYAIVVVVALISSPLIAQYRLYDAPPPKWSLFGNAGFDFAHGGLASTLGSKNIGTSSSQQLGGVMDATLEGFVFNPQFLSFTTSVTDNQGASSSSGTAGDVNLPSFDARNGGLSYSGSAIFLAGRGKPLYLHYTKTDTGLTSSLFRNDQGTREWGALWRGKLPHLPNLSLDYRDETSQVAIPTSLYDTNNAQKFLDTNAHDRVLGWDWSGNFSTLQQEVSTVGTATLPQSANTHALNESFSIGRGFFDGVLSLRGGQQFTVNNTTGSLGRTDYNLMGYNASIAYRPEGKFSANGVFNREAFESTGTQTGVAPGLPIVLFALPSTTVTSATGTTEYRPFTFLTLSNGASVSDIDVPSTTEQLQRTVTPFSNTSVRFFWHRFDINAHGGVAYRITTSNLGRNANGLSHNYGANVSRGEVQTVRWTAKFQSTHEVLPQILGAFSDSTVAGFTAEAERWGNWRLIGGVDYSKIDILTVGGKFNSKGFGFNVGLSKETKGIRFFRTHNTGDGALFPAQFSTSGYLIDLPVSQLVSSPLLNRTGNVTGLNGYFGWRRWLINGSLTRERDFFSQTNQQYNYINIDARYTLGKFTLDAGFSRNVLNTGINSVWSGTNYNRYRFRITRSFNVF